ncbi:composite domain of metallo-dependent hydrolase [Phanerochaete sordida]|uniref:Composite domain of metallo-dependent hydrolase n=1 Tax=Phanerochaete sordida TaxID=48140 RepID=A0A9P3FYB8_9APHY|nr:composite domain of metallo-dependent hydrolase [Phanerochaete sordida]
MSSKGSEPFIEAGVRTRRRTLKRPLLLALCATVATLSLYACNIYLASTARGAEDRVHRVPAHAKRILRQCAALRATPEPPHDFHTRAQSDRYEPGTRPTLIKNARVWTGARNGTETVKGDVLLEGGVVKGIGYIPEALLDSYDDLATIHAGGAWVTPGLVDLHSHVGLLSAPFTAGAFEVNSIHGPALPWLRSIDGFNTHDLAFELAIAGGVTSAMVLPGSGNAIGGQAFMMKLRKTKERSPTSMIVEPPHTLNGTVPDPDLPLRWRHMKQACGENLRRYGNRMDAIWAFRSAYNEARKVKQGQDDFCMKAEAGLWEDIHDQNFPENLQWEMLVDVLRGRVKIANHCYEEVDLDDIVRLTNEFGFPIASFHHASEAWLVPDVLKRTWGGTPAVAIFASNHRYKRESYRGSQFAPRVLADNEIPVVMKSDHPVLNSRYVVYEAQQAHYYGLPPHLALASVTSTPARAAGLSHRIGLLAEGTDADVVLWDSHPLHLGATPRQVWIDGIPQLGRADTALTPLPDTEPVLVGPPKNGAVFDEVPAVPNWDLERKQAVAYEGLPPLGPAQARAGKVVLRNVQEVWTRTETGLKERWSGARDADGRSGTVVLVDGAISCVGQEGWCLAGAEDADDALEIDLHGGAVGPGLMTFGSPLGLEEITQEPSTGDGALYNPYAADTPALLGDTGALVRAADALQFGTRNALTARRAGVTYATTALGETTLFGGASTLIGGLAVTFRTGAAHALQPDAIVKPVAALQVHVGRAAPWRGSLAPVSVSTQIATLRRLLLDSVSDKEETGRWFKKAADGEIPLIIGVGSADIMATLLQLKAEVEELRGGRIKMVFSGASEAHLIAEDIAKAKVGVILNPVRPFPGTWDNHRILAGPPISNETTVTALLKHKITVALGVTDAWEPVNTRFDAGWVALESSGRIDKQAQYALITGNLEKLLGLEGWLGDQGDLVVYQGGGAFNMSSKAIAIASPRHGTVELF